MRKKEEHILNKTEVTMLCWIQGISFKDICTRIEGIQKRSKVKLVVAHVSKWMLSWYGYIRRRDREDITRIVLDKEGFPEAGPASDE